MSVPEPAPTVAGERIARRTSGAPAVSVLLPVYNGGEALTQALASLRDQTFVDYEVIVVDDGSTDDTAARISAAANDDQRVRCLRHPVNEGLLASLSDGLAAASGEFVARLDADDLCAPDRLELQVAALRADPRRVLCWSAYARRDLDTDEERGVIVPHTDHAPMQLALARSNRIMHSSVMFRTAAVREVGGYRAEWYPAEDYDLWCRLLAHGIGIGLARPLVVWRLNPRGISLTNVATQADAVRRRACAEQARLGVSSVQPHLLSRRGLTVAERRLATAVRSDLRARSLPTRGVADEAVATMARDLRETGRLARWVVIASVSPIDAGRFWYHQIATRFRG
jgi:cellulose synthase/poly-beta-1,6-N-acetylglucosamine synthase-like glycosyltransferase